VGWMAEIGKAGYTAVDLLSREGVWQNPPASWHRMAMLPE